MLATFIKKKSSDMNYNSPVPDIDFIRKNEDKIWPVIFNMPGIQLPDDNLFSDIELPPMIWADKKVPQLRYFYENGWFEKCDAEGLFKIAHIFKPKNIVEIGCGLSTALMLDIRDNYDIEFGTDITCVEPYPERLLSVVDEKSLQSINFIQSIVQNAYIDQQIKQADLLFVDGSHISKCGSDVNHILFNLIHKLKQGAIIHFHDIIFPFEYHKHWIFEGRVSWNEVYLIRAFLMYNQHYKIVQWFSSIGKGGGSIYIQKIF